MFSGLLYGLLSKNYLEEFMNCSNPMCKYGQDQSCCNPVHKFENVGRKYRKIGTQLMRPYVQGEDLTGVSVSERDTPGEGGMIAIGKDDGALWYVSKTFFTENYELVDR